VPGIIGCGHLPCHLLADGRWKRKRCRKIGLTNQYLVRPEKVYASGEVSVCSQGTPLWSVGVRRSSSTRYYLDGIPDVECACRILVIMGWLAAPRKEVHPIGNRVRNERVVKLLLSDLGSSIFPAASRDCLLGRLSILTHCHSFLKLSPRNYLFELQEHQSRYASTISHPWAKPLWKANSSFVRRTLPVGLYHLCDLIGKLLRIPG
jgi:hypothetical protein